jgi:amidase
MTTSTHWKDLIADKQQRQAESLPKEWIIQTPPPTLLDVTHVPESCDLLTERELHITNTSDVELLLKKLSSAEWSAVEVTTAYYKRAIVAQQLVSVADHFLYEITLTHLNPDKLFD